jgi:LmbE family N-acetylglucosaminyl deacetylase
MEEAVGRLVAVIRAERPQVVVSYDPGGTYGHPDHVKAHRVAQAAFWAAGDPSRFPEAGQAWTPRKLYEQVIPRTQMERVAEVLREAGVERPTGEEDAMRERVLRYAVADAEVTTRIELADLVDEKRRASSPTRPRSARRAASRASRPSCSASSGAARASAASSARSRLALTGSRRTCSRDCS